MRESTAIRRLQRLAVDWPSTLWVFATDGRLNIMRCGTDGEPAMTDSGGFDEEALLESIDIPADGGDW